MKLLFFAERTNISLFKGDSLLLKRMMEGLAAKGNEVQALCHGSSDKIKVHVPLSYWLYTKAFTFPLTSFFSFRKLVSLLEKQEFDAVILKIPECNGNGFWFNFRPLIKTRFYSMIADELKKRKIPFFVFIEGVTEKESFVSFLMDCSKKSMLHVMKESNGIISLSTPQNEILKEFGLTNPMAFFPAPVDTKKYLPEKTDLELNLSKEKINLLYLSSSCDLKDFTGFFGFLEENDCILFIISPFSNAQENLIKELKKRGLEKKVVFLKGFSDEFLFKVIPFFDAGVYLKKFGSAFADASFMVKISEYLSCGLPVLVPEINGPIKQAGNAGINFEKTKKVSKAELKLLSVDARNNALNFLDLEKNTEKLIEFIRKNSG